MDLRKTEERIAEASRTLLTWLTPGERRAIIVIALLIILGFAVKTLRGV